MSCESGLLIDITTLIPRDRYISNINDANIHRIWVKASIWPILRRNRTPTVRVVFVYKYLVGFMPKFRRTQFQKEYEAQIT
jgi:hypothetical protein